MDWYVFLMFLWFELLHKNILFLLKHNKNESTAMKHAGTISRNGLGKTTHFGHDYTTTQRLVTYLGTTEGQPGGSGAPLRNKFWVWRVLVILVVFT